MFQQIAKIRTLGEIIIDGNFNGIVVREKNDSVIGKFEEQVIYKEGKNRTPNFNRNPSVISNLVSYTNRGCCIIASPCQKLLDMTR